MVEAFYSELVTLCVPELPEGSPDESYRITLRFNSSEKFRLPHSLSQIDVSELAGEIKSFLNCKIYGLPR